MMKLLTIALIACCGIAQAQQGLDATVNALGGVDRLSLAGKLVGQGLRLAIVKPSWGGSLGSQEPGGGLELEGPQGGTPRTVAGQLRCEGKPCRFEEVITQLGDTWRLSYKLTPSADLETELILVRVELPVAGNAGQGEFFLCDGQTILRKPLPATLPDPYHIAGANQIAWCGWLLPGDVGLRIEPDGTGITGVSFQDNRQFKADAFEAQFGVRDSHGLKAGKTYEFGLTLRPLTRAALAAEQKRIVDLAKALEVNMTSHKPLALRGVKLSAPQIAQYEKLELDLDLDATYDNPFDPRDIDVTATFTDPGGKAMNVPGFYWQDYQKVKFGDEERLEPLGEPRWKVRFAPPAPGEWTVRVTARDRSGQAAAEPARFTCTAGAGRGFVRRCPDNPYYLEFDNKAPYFAVGENVCWSSGGNVEQYAEWFKALGAAGGNYCRIWLVRWNMGLEWKNEGYHSGVFYGLGKYSMDNAYRLDRVMELAQKSGIYCMLSLGYHGELQDQEDYFHSEAWKDSPYNKANGGPCAKPKEFWTDPEARRLYQQKLRYYAARYGWDTHVLSWEFWNEVTAPAPWVDEMAKYFKAHDPYNHLVTTTYGYDEVWRIPELDYTQAHTYGSDEDRPETVPAIATLGRDFTTKWPKPFMVGEFGIDWKTSDAKHDPAGLGTSMHDGLWSSLMTRCFGTASIWYWDDYVHKKNLYHELTSVKKFADTVPWPKLKLELAGFERPTLPVAPNASWGDVRAAGTLSWSKATGTDFTVNPDGAITGQGEFSSLLFADSKKDLKALLRFHVTYPQDGKLIMRISTVSNGVTLHVRLDGKEHWTRELPAGGGEGEWKSTKYYEQWKLWQSVYDKDYEVAIPAGKHVIEIENTGKDWVSIPSYTFTGCRDPKFAGLDLLGLRTQDFALLWVHDPQSNWYNDKYGKKPQEITGAKTALLGLKDGAYRIEWWDTRKGEPFTTTTTRSLGGRLDLQVPTFLRDVAAKVTAG